MSQHEVALRDVLGGLKRLEMLLVAANQHLTCDNPVASALVNAARDEVTNLLTESSAYVTKGGR